MKSISAPVVSKPRQLTLPGEPQRGLVAVAELVGARAGTLVLQIGGCAVSVQPACPRRFSSVQKAVFHDFGIWLNPPPKIPGPADDWWASELERHGLGEGR